MAANPEGIVTIHGIPGQDGYFVSKDGRVFKEKNLSVSKNGYPFTGFRRGDKSRYIHEIVLSTFVGDRPDGASASHLNGNREDNRLENLTWESHADNCARRSDHGTLRHGEEHYAAVVSPADVYYIRSLKNTGYGFFKRLSDRLGYNVNTIRDIYHRKTWRNV